MSYRKAKFLGDSFNGKFYWDKLPGYILYFDQQRGAAAHGVAGQNIVFLHISPVVASNWGEKREKTAEQYRTYPENLLILYLK